MYRLIALVFTVLIALPTTALACSTSSTENCGSFCKSEGAGCELAGGGRGHCVTQVQGDGSSTCTCFPGAAAQIDAESAEVFDELIAEMLSFASGCASKSTCGLSAVCTGGGEECTTSDGYVGHCQTVYDGFGGTECSCKKGRPHSQVPAVGKVAHDAVALR